MNMVNKWLCSRNIVYYVGVTKTVSHRNVVLFPLFPWRVHVRCFTRNIAFTLRVLGFARPSPFPFVHLRRILGKDRLLAFVTCYSGTPLIRPPSGHGNLVAKLWCKMLLNDIILQHIYCMPLIRYIKSTLLKSINKLTTAIQCNWTM